MNSIFKRSDVKINKEEFQLLRDYIYEQTGIWFNENKMYLLNNRLNKRLLETNSANYKDYYYYLKYDNSGTEFTKLINVITTNETSFFRNSFHMDAIENYVIPMLQEKKKNGHDRKIKIWSAGCSSGEEPYTLAIILLEKGVNRQFDIEIVGNDLSENVLSIARQGIYNKLTLRNTPQKILDKYFVPMKNNQYQIKDDVKKYVKFMHGNLSKSSTLMLVRDRDVILCRNVLIYFALEARKKVIKMFYDKLVKDGHLFIGHSETLHGISTAFKIVHHNKAIFYKKIS